MKKVSTLTQPTISSASNAKVFYELLFAFYPEEYRKEYSSEMRMLFSDLYQEELEKNGDISIGFWLRVVFDVIFSTTSQHFQLLQNIGVKSYFMKVLHLNAFSGAGLLLMVPFVIFFTIDRFTALLTGTNEGLSLLYNTQFWPIFITFVVLIFPLSALVLSIYFLMASYRIEERKVWSMNFLINHFIEALIILGCIGILILAIGHDAVPCTLHRLHGRGLLKIAEIVNYCLKNS